MAEKVFKLNTSQGELNLLHCLTSGQAFRWRLEHDGWWRAIVRGTLMGIRPAGKGFECFTLPEPDRLDLIQDYFRLEDDLLTIYARLAAADEHVAELVDEFRGLRLLRQEPVETILSFVCSAANSIPRISAAIDVIARKYGKPVARWRDQDFFSFPDVFELARADSGDLSATAGLGFRAINLIRLARQLEERPREWLEELKAIPYSQAKAELLLLDGIGQKIADCVCLFSLDKDEAVPVDTHVRQLTARLFAPDMTAKTVTPAVYERVTHIFQERFGGLAGWAQQFLYYEDVLLSRERRTSGSG